LIRNPALYLADRVGQVLYAAGDSEPELAGAVVLILRYDPAVGAIGVVVNRVDTEPGGALAESWVAALGESVVYTGGPARPEGFIPLALLRPGVVPPQRFRAVAGRLGTIALSADAAAVAGAVERVRVFSGYLGWGPGGLEADLAREVLVPTHVGPGLVLSEAPDHLWHLVQAAG
jgi:putative transcriptional regulator